MIFSKRINEIFYEDVMRFAEQQVSEGINLDYKRDFTADLAKTISAFANAHGGVILIGIEDKDSKPLLPAKGIPYADRLQERVTQICVEAIYPPIFPEIQVCPPINNKTFVVIRIPESNQSPHAINNREDIYVRTGNITKLENRANIENIQWLLDKRLKSVQLRKHLQSRALSHFEGRINQGKRRGQIAHEFKLHSHISLSMTPLFPYQPMSSPQYIKENLPSWGVHVGEYSFPRLDLEMVSPTEGGVSIFFYNPTTRYVLYNEINQYGLIFYLDDMITTKEEENDDGTKHKIDYLYEDRILGHLRAFLTFAAKLYSLLGFWGHLELNLAIKDIDGVSYIPYHGRYRPAFGPQIVDIPMTPESLSYETTVAEIQQPEGLQNLAIKVLGDFDWSVGHESNKKALIERITSS